MLRFLARGATAHGVRTIGHRLPRRRFGLTLLACAMTGLLLASTADAQQDRADYYRLNCASCHTIGGGRTVGPDLHAITEKRDRQWLIDFIVDPAGVINAGDEQANALLREYGGIVMPAVPGINPQLADELLDFIDQQSGLEQTDFAGPAGDAAPLTDQDAAHGRRLFTGQANLASGAASCMACHNHAQTGLVGGGDLGPDLTHVFDRLGGQAGLTGWLSAPPTPMMRAIYHDKPLTQEEIRALVALFKQTAAQPPVSHAGDSGRSLFVIVSLLLTGAALVGLNLAWRNRSRGVRQLLVQQARNEETHV